jgi:hypothetical protein
LAATVGVEVPHHRHGGVAAGPFFFFHGFF